MNYKIDIIKPIMLDIDIDRLKKTLYTNNMNFDSISFNGHLITIITNVNPKKIWDLVKTKLNNINYTKEDTICQK